MSNGQTTHLLITLIMMLKSIAEKLALEITLSFLTLGFTMDEVSIFMAINMATWEETRKNLTTKLTKTTYLPEDMGLEMMLPILVLVLVMRNPNLMYAKRLILTGAAGSWSLIPQVTAAVWSAYLSESMKAKLSYKALRNG